MLMLDTLKRRGKRALFENFWKCVFAGLVLLVFCYGGVSTSSSFNLSDSTSDTEETITEGTSSNEITLDDFIDTESLLNGDSSESLQQALDAALSASNNAVFRYVVKIGEYSIPIAGIAGVIVLILSIFVFNILEVGGCRFFLMNSDSADTGAGELLYGFRNPNYSSMVTIMLLRKIKILLWSVLMVIPGVVKSYEYMMVPYLLSEYPEMDHKEVFAESRRLMNGNKWEAFLLDLSFLGWSLLSTITLGLSGIFFSNPYQYAAKAEMVRVIETLHGYDDGIDDSDEAENEETDHSEEIE